jgi:hypothetical protein
LGLNKYFIILPAECGFGASQPGYTAHQVYDWIEFMKSRNIKRVCCLLSEKQLANYHHLLDIYQQEFGN